MCYLGYVDLQTAPRAEVFATKHTGVVLPGVGVPVQDVHLEVALLARRDVGTVGAVPPPKRLHHHHVCQPVLQRHRQHQQQHQKHQQYHQDHQDHQQEQHRQDKHL